MGKSAAEPRDSRKDDDDEFDASLGLVLGDTWWKLGKKFAGALNVTGKTRTEYLDSWVADVRRELEAEGMNEPIGGVTPDAVMEFVSTVMDLLQNKYDGKPIARDVRRLTRKASDFNVYDTDQFLDIQEPAEVFWAVEYDFLFSRLDKAIPGGGWLNAVGRCADPECNAFFIKTRSDQRHHTAACRTRAANRQAYSERTERSHTKRGRPRLRR